METIGAFEAKTHLASLLDRVAQGKRITITRHGVPAAMLTHPSDGRKADASRDVEAMRELRKQVRRGKMSVRELVNQGRRFERDRHRCFGGASLVLPGRRQRLRRWHTG